MGSKLIKSFLFCAAVLNYVALLWASPWSSLVPGYLALKLYLCMSYKGGSRIFALVYCKLIRLILEAFPRSTFFLRCPGGGRTWDLLVFIYFPSLKQRLRPLGYCAPLSLGVLLKCHSSNNPSKSSVVTLSYFRSSVSMF